MDVQVCLLPDKTRSMVLLPRALQLTMIWGFQMPTVDGLQSTRLIREMGFSAPIVALSAFAEESNVKECIDSGMDFFLPKPIRRPALKQVLKRYCATIPEASEEADRDVGPSKDGDTNPS